MIRGSMERLAILCAAAGITASEWDEFASEAQELSSTEMRRLYSKIRAQVRGIERALNNEDAPADRDSNTTTSSVIRDVYRLIDEADLSAPVAARQLLRELQIRTPYLDDDRFSFNTKDGLRKWLGKLIREFGESQVLSAAASAFRSRSTKSDWQLS